jgi:hypothetical protein
MLHYVKGDKLTATSYTAGTDHVILLWQLSQERDRQNMWHTQETTATQADYFIVLWICIYSAGYAVSKIVNYLQLL